MKNLFKNLFTWRFGTTTKNELRFVDVLKEYIGRYLTENDLGQGTRDRYDVYYRNISLFLASHKWQGLEIGEVKIKHMEELRNWLRLNLKTCSITHASRHLELCKNVTKYALKMEYIYHDPLTPIDAQRSKDKEIVYLEQSEVKRIMAYKFQNAFMQMTADLFIFQCATGVSYKDIYDHEIVERNGYTLILGSRKNEVRYEARVFKEAKDILEKYEGKLPVIPNQRYNIRIKEIAGILGIKKHLTTHVARKTHATILTERGANTKVISLQLGNTEKVIEKHYCGKNNKIVENEFERIGVKEHLLVQ